MSRDLNEFLVAALQELSFRKKEDGLRLFTPFAKQQIFINNVLQGHYSENLYLGANRSGKSDAGAYIGAQLARFGYPENSPFAARYVTGQGSSIHVRDRATSGWVSCLDFPTSRDVMQPKLFNNGFGPPGQHLPFIPDREIARFNPNDNILQLKNGSIVGFKSVDSGRRKYQGSEKDWILMDEEHPEAIYEECRIRIGQRPVNIFHTCTLLPPEGQAGGISWMFRRFIKPWKANQAPHVGIVTASIYDNPHVSRDDISKLEAIYPEGSAQRRIRLNGELLPGMHGLRAYGSFSHELNVRPVNQPNEFTPICWCWDFNVAPFVTYLGYRQGLTYIVFEEFILEEGSIPEMVALFRSKYPRHPSGIQIYGDALGRQTSTHTRVSAYQLIMQHLREYPSPVTLCIPESNPPVTVRLDSVNYVCKSENGHINLLVDPKCQELLDDFDQVLTDNRGGIKKIHKPGDPYTRRTHMTDAIGYWITQGSPILATTQKKAFVTPRPKYRKNQ